jgi:hypothetical protein
MILKSPFLQFNHSVTQPQQFNLTSKKVRKISKTLMTKSTDKVNELSRKTTRKLFYTGLTGIRCHCLFFGKGRPKNLILARWEMYFWYAPQKIFKFSKNYQFMSQTIFLELLLKKPMYSYYTGITKTLRASNLKLLPTPLLPLTCWHPWPTCLISISVPMPQTRI